MKWPKDIPVGPLLIPIEERSLRNEDGLCGIYLHAPPYVAIQYDEEILDDGLRDITIAHEVIEAWLRGCGMTAMLAEDQIYSEES